MSFIDSNKMCLGLATASVAALFSGYSIYKNNQKKALHDQIKTIFKQCTTHDIYKNCNIDLSNQKIPANQEAAAAVHEQLNAAVKSETEKHMVTVKIARAQTSLFQPILDAGFEIHNPQSKFVEFKKCRLNHNGKDCWFPRYHTALIGITAVVFNQKADKVLLVKEKYAKAGKFFKPVTGVVETESMPSKASEVDAKAKHESLAEAAAREVQEETGVVVNSESGVLVGLYSARNPNKGITDLNFTWVFTSPTEAATKSQEAEIDVVSWESVDAYLSVKEEKPLLMRNTVRAALEALQKQKSLTAKTFHFSSGTPIKYYSAL